MSATRTCPQCGALLQNGALEGLCQDCLGKLALADPVAPEASPAGSGSDVAVGANAGPGGPLSPQPAMASTTRFGDYELIEEIAHGGMGVVYKARQVSLNRTVAVKMIRAGQFASKEFVHRFRVEASAAAVLQHPNIVAVHEVGVHDGQHFFSMDYVAGKNLAQIVRDGPLPPNRAARYVQKIAEAIHYAHQSGILHRDLKPSNVLIDQNDQPRITDFGLAKQLNVESSATLTGEVMGTPGYMPPEQASGNRGAVKAWSDVYSLGAVLYHLLTGRAPFAAGSLEETLNQVLHKDPVSIRLLNPAVARDLDTICLKCLEKEPGKRYGSAQLLTEELARFLNKEPILARPISTVGKGWRWCRRKPALASVLGLLVVIAVGSPIAALRINRARHAEQRERQRAQATVTKLEIVAAENLFEKDKSAEALAYLGRVLRREPTNRVAAERILSALSYRSFCLPLARVQHQAEVTAAQFSPNGQQILTASKDKSARVWDSHSGRLLAEFKHANEVLTAQFSPDGNYVLTASGDQVARIWDAATAQVLQELRHEASVLSANFSGDGRRVVTGGKDDTVRVWDASMGKALSGPYRLGGPVDHVQFSLDGTLIAAMSVGRVVRILNAESGAEVAALPSTSAYRLDQKLFVPQFNWESHQVFAGSGFSFEASRATIWTFNPKLAVLAQVSHPSVIYSVALHADGAVAATASQDNTAQLWDVVSGKNLAVPMRHQDWVYCVQFSPDGRQLATGSKDNTARLWDARSGTPSSEPLEHQSGVYSLQFSVDGQRLLTTCADGSVWVWSLRSRQSSASVFQHGSNVRDAVFSSDSARVATVGRAGTVRLWSTRRTDPLIESLRISGQGPFDNVQFSRDGRWVAVASGAVQNTVGFVQVWDTSTANPMGRMLGIPELKVGYTSVRFSPTGEHAVAAGPTNANVWELSTGRLVSSLPHNAPSHLALFSPDGQWILTVSHEAIARVWNWRSRQPRFPEGLRHDDRVLCADISPDGRWIATLSRDKTARIWDASTGHMRTQPLRHAGEPYHYNSIQFSPDGQRLVTAAGNDVQIWDPVTGHPTGTALKHNARVNSVRFSPDAQRVVTAGTDGAARIWDAKTGHLLGEPYEHQGRVNYAEFSGEGQWLITASVDGTARLWEVPQVGQSVPAWLADLAEAVAARRLLEGDINEKVPFEKQAKLRETLSNTPALGPLGQWPRWIFADGPTRSTSPSSSIAISDLVAGRIQDNSVNSLREAVALSPGHLLAQARLAWIELTNGMNDPLTKARSDWQSLRTARLAAGDPEVLWLRALTCERLGRLAEAIDTMQRCIQRNPTNPHPWNDWGLMLERTNRLEETLQAYTKAIQLSGPWKDTLSHPAIARLNRARVLSKLNRLDEASGDNLAAVNAPVRDPEGPRTLIDLSLFYTAGLDYEFGWTEGHSYLSAGLAPGRRILQGTEFDLRGFIALQAVDSPPRGAKVMDRISGIPIHQKCRRLQFLHAVSGRVSLEGTLVGAYVIHQDDGRSEEIPLRSGEHLRFFDRVDDPRETLASHSALVWTGTNAANFPIRLFRTTWTNPHPEVLVRTIDFISSLTHSQPLLFAITGEP